MNRALYVRLTGRSSAAHAGGGFLFSLDAHAASLPASKGALFYRGRDVCHDHILFFCPVRVVTTGSDKFVGGRND